MRGWGIGASSSCGGAWGRGRLGMGGAQGGKAALGKIMGILRLQSFEPLQALAALATLRSRGCKAVYM